MKKRARIKIFINTIGLMENYAPEEITIKMICAYSGINRSTFYDYFQDKYDLFEQIQNYHMSRYQKLMHMYIKILKPLKRIIKSCFSFSVLSSDTLIDFNDFFVPSLSHIHKKM